MALAAVTHDGDLLALDEVQVGVAIVINTHGRFLWGGQNRLVNQAVRRATPGGERNFPALSRTFSRPVERRFCMARCGIHASMKTGIREASSRIAMTTLKMRTALGEESSGRSTEPNSAQAEQDKAPRIRLMPTWIAMFHGKAAIAA